MFNEQNLPVFTQENQVMTPESLHLLMRKEAEKFRDVPITREIVLRETDRKRERCGSVDRGICL